MIVLIPYIKFIKLFLDKKMSIFEEYGAFTGVLICMEALLHFNQNEF